jgi:hypothetical protein
MARKTAPEQTFPVEVEHDGETHRGTAVVSSDKRLTVRHELGGSKTAHAGLEPRALAQIMLLEIACALQRERGNRKP